MTTGRQPPAESTTTHPVDEVMAPGRMTLYGVQHLLTFFATIVVFPSIIAAGIGLSPQQTTYLLSAVVFAGGVGTLIQTVGLWKTGIRLPLILGGSAVAIGPMIAVGNTAGGGADGLLLIYGATIVAGAVMIVIAPVYGRLMRFFPPIVIGTIITMVGFSILPVGVMLAGGGDPTADDFASSTNLIIAFGTIACIVAIYRFFPGFLSNICILIGLIFGGLLGAALGVVDLDAVGDADWLGFVDPFHFGWPRFEVSASISMTIAMIVVTVESVASFFAVGEIVGRSPSRNDVNRGIRGEGLATVVGAVFNAFPPTAFNGNVGLVRASNVKSRWVCALAGLLMLLLGCLPKVAALAAVLPQAAVGAALLVLFGIIAGVGVQTLSRCDLTDNSNLVIVAVSFGIGTIPIAYPEFFQHFPEDLRVVLESGIVTSALSAITLNIVFHHLHRRRNAATDETPAGSTPADEPDHKRRRAES